jgi:hypothetical protein
VQHSGTCTLPWCSARVPVNVDVHWKFRFVPANWNACCKFSICFLGRVREDFSVGPELLGVGISWLNEAGCRESWNTSGELWHVEWAHHPWRFWNEAKFLSKLHKTIIFGA